MDSRIHCVSRLSKFAFVTAIVALTGCATTNTINTVDSLSAESSDPKILVMPMDVELSILTTVGLQEPQGEWTAAASEHMETAVLDKISAYGYTSHVVEEPSTDPGSDLVQLERLHEAVGQMALIHQMGITTIPLPSKHGEFDWSLGEKAKALKEETESDYALFVFFRDSYSSAGRVALQIGMALLGGYATGGQQVGFASLVDLNTGDIVWFNFLASGTGDARKPETAVKTVDNLMDGFPTKS